MDPNAISGDFLTIRQVDVPAGWSICLSDAIYAPTHAAKTIFGVSPHDLRGNMLLYLFRRFGYPRSGWDPDKSVISYFLATPDPEVVVWCSPAAQPQWSFGYGIAPTLADAALQACMQYAGSWADSPLHQRIDAAIRTALSELLRPVLIRNAAYNVLGRFREQEGHAGFPSIAAECSPQAGYGLGWFDPAKAYGNEPSTPPPVDPIMAIKQRMAALELKPVDLVPFLGSRSKVSEVLAGKRVLSLSMIRALHVGLGLPADVLIQEYGAHDDL